MVNRIILFTVALMTVFSSTNAQPTNEPRQELLFNSGWSFSKDDNPDYKNSTFNDEKWRKLNLPHDFTIEGKFNKDAACGASGAFLEGGVAWYRKTFELPLTVTDKSVSIKFDGIYMNSQVWVNDTYLGLYPYGYSQIAYDLTGIVKPGQKNVIAVRVDNAHEPSSRYYAGAGIYRNVWLTISDFTRFDHVDGVFVSYKNVTAKSAVVQCAYTIATAAFEGSEFEWWRQNTALNKRIHNTFIVQSEIYEPNGKLVAQSKREVQLLDFSNTKVISEVLINNPDLWSAESPNLYTLKSSIYLAGKLIDEVKTKIGVRSLVFSTSQGMLINDKQVKMKGVCMHQDAGALGSVIPKEVWIYRLSKLKKMGANAIRTAHNPFSKEFYEVCDSIGFYVMDEAFDEWNLGYDFKTNTNPGGKMKYGYHMFFNQWAETDLKAMILRSRNHPSVVMYSIGNEIPNQLLPSGKQELEKLQQICHHADSTRPVTAGFDLVQYAEENGFLSTLDIAGYNYVGRYTSSEMYKPIKEKFPNRLFVGTETYHDINYWLAVRDNDYVIGEFVWAGFDYLGEGLAWPKRGWDACFIDMAGNEYPEYYLRKSFWSKEPVVCFGVKYADTPESGWHPLPLKSHWNWKWTAAYLLDAYIYSNCEEVEIFINNVSKGKFKNDSNKNVVEFKIPYEPGEVKAVGYNQNKAVCEHLVRTAQEASELQIVVDKNQLNSGRGNLAFLEIAVVDKNGILVSDAQQDIEIEIKGDAALLGLDNGDQRNHQAYKTNTRKAFNGKLLATIQKGTSKGKIFVIAKSNGLKSATIELMIQ